MAISGAYAEADRAEIDRLFLELKYSSDFSFIDRPEHPQLLPIVDYLVALNEAHKWPTRQDFEPSKVRRSLERLILMDVIEAGRDYRCRLCGTKAALVLGQDLTSKHLSALAPEIRARWAPFFRKVLLEKRMFVYRMALTEFKKDHFLYEGLVFPFFNESEAVNLILLAGAALQRVGQGEDARIIFNMDF